MCVIFKRKSKQKEKINRIERQHRSDWAGLKKPPPFTFHVIMKILNLSKCRKSSIMNPYLPIIQLQ